MKAIPSLSRWDEIVDAAEAAELEDLEDMETRAVDTLTWVEPIASRLAGAGAAAMNDAPTRRRGGDSIFQSLMRLWPGEGRRPLASARAMARLRGAFRASVVDLADRAEAAADPLGQERVRALLRNIVHSRHPQDLWHLRTAIYTEVARCFDQAEAEARLVALNRQLEQNKSLLRRLIG
ncbi:hypothetical protein CDN99_00850 [Roseateles aquatilis]|uniref:Uncharacterized protein n=1 Tax=Roseateles aquatilis TaxID=431061 RepID=A0A246JKA9_9BURK|nr:hypothetical protein [Roseateles aquatilis]OWQ93086.1 hypothetical protein CDN99_00850 [Roseateles aquatilis]